MANASVPYPESDCQPNSPQPFNVIEPPCPLCGNDMVLYRRITHTLDEDVCILQCIDGGCEGARIVLTRDYLPTTGARGSIMTDPTPQGETTKLLSAMTDRELLAVFVRTLQGCDWLSVIRDSVDDACSPGLNSWEDHDYQLLLAEYYMLYDAVREAYTRQEVDHD